MCAFRASGIYVPPLFIYARKRMAPQLRQNEPPGAIYECSDNGWITEALFITWLKHFYNFTKSSQNDPVLLVMDNHVSHCTLKAYSFCRENGIIVLTIPPHTSHRLFLNKDRKQNKGKQQNLHSSNDAKLYDKIIK